MWLESLDFSSLSVEELSLDEFSFSAVLFSFDLDNLVDYASELDSFANSNSFDEYPLIPFHSP